MNTEITILKSKIANREEKITYLENENTEYKYRNKELDKNIESLKLQACNDQKNFDNLVVIIHDFNIFKHLK